MEKASVICVLYESNHKQSIDYATQLSKQIRQSYPSVPLLLFQTKNDLQLHNEIIKKSMFQTLFQRNYPSFSSKELHSLSPIYVSIINTALNPNRGFSIFRKGIVGVLLLIGLSAVIYGLSSYIPKNFPDRLAKYWIPISEWFHRSIQTLLPRIRISNGILIGSNPNPL